MTRYQPGADVIDSRELACELDGLEEVESPDQEVLDRIAELSAIRDYAEDWEYGATLIRDSYFESYAMELADDIGAIPADVSWPLTCIDWKQAARELQMDYSSVELDGYTYWVR